MHVPDELSGSSQDRALELLDSLPSADLQLLGTLYELVNGSPIGIASDGRVYMEAGDKRKHGGQFFTPPWVVRYCMEAGAPAPLISFMSAFETSGKDCAGMERPGARHFKMLDPACGTGNFLLGAVDWFRENGMPRQRLAAFIRSSLYGMELDGRAASLCRLSLVLCTADHVAMLLDKEGDQSAAAFVSGLVADLSRHVVVTDAVCAAASARGKGAFGSLPPLQRFDLVAGNPPYVSYGSRNQQTLSDSQRRFLRLFYPDASEYKIRLHSVFQEVALEYAAEGGRVVLLLPDAFLSGRYYEKLRRKLLSDSRLLSLTELPESTIAGATVGRWCVAAYEKRPGRQADSYEVALHSFLKDDALGPAAETGQSQGPGRPLRSFAAPLDILVSPDRHRFRLFFHRLDMEIWRKLDTLPPLSSVLRGHTGIRARNGQSSITADRPHGPTWKKGLASGSLVSRHHARWDGTWLNVDARLLFGGGFDPAVVERPKLLIRQTGDRVVAAYDDRCLYHLNNIHSFSPVAPLPTAGARAELLFLEGLVNSALWLYLYRHKTREGGRALAQIDIEMVESMPLAEAEVRSIAAIASLTEAASRLCADGGAASNGTSISLENLERSIDRLVYDLYGLAPEEVEHVEAGICPVGTVRQPLPDRDAALSLAETFEHTPQCLALPGSSVFPVEPPKGGKR